LCLDMSRDSPDAASSTSVAATLLAPSRDSSCPEQSAEKADDKGCNSLGLHAACATAVADKDSSHVSTSTRACAELGVERSLGAAEATAELTRASAEKAAQEAGGKGSKPRSALPGICHHGRQRTRCKECDGSSFCEHRRLRHYCKQCGGSGICAHGRRKSDCKECQGSSICEHGKQKRQCRECLALYGACEHGKAKNRYCKQCGNIAARTYGDHDKQARDVLAATVPAAAAAPEVAAAISAAVSHIDGMQLQRWLQPHIPFAGYGLPSTASFNPPLPMPLLPAPLAIQTQPGFNLHLMLARANYASLAQQQQQQNLQQVQCLLQQQALGPFNVLAPGLALSPVVSQPQVLPLGQLQQPINASQRAATAFTPFR
jgi:hypothetical protein